MTRPGVPSAKRTATRARSAHVSSWRLFRGLRIHLAALVAGLFCVFYLLTAILIYGLTARLSQDNVDAILRDTTQPLAARVVSALDQGQFPTQFIALAKLSQMYPKVSAIVLRDPQGNVIASTAPLVTRTLSYQSVGSTSLMTTDHVLTQGWYRVLTLRLTNPYKQTIGFLQMAMNVDRDRIALARLGQVLFLVGGLGIGFAAAAGFLLSKLSLRPAVRAWKLQEQFVADASHELRTPLTVMRVNLEVVNSIPDATVADNTRWLQSIEQEIHRLHRLTEQLLTLARSDGVVPTAVLRSVNVRPLMTKAWEAFRLPAAAKGLALRVSSHPSELEPAGAFTVFGDVDALYQLLTILLDNAITYTVAGEIDLHVERRRHEVLLSVRDTGIGIEASHRERVFDRFYRTDAARAKSSGGAGLGLSIARAITTAHRGRIAVHSTPGLGTTVLVSLPAAARLR